VRHRLCAISQESQRYVDYGKKEFMVICPKTIGLDEGIYVNGESPFQWANKHGDNNVDQTSQVIFLNQVASAYDKYLALRKIDIPPEDARCILPNATKTELAMTFNLRMWRHVFKERALNEHAQWQIREIMLGILYKFAELLPEVFGDLIEETE